MTNGESDDRTAGVAAGEHTDEPGVDPRNTDHPTGAQQADENAANEPPS